MYLGVNLKTVSLEQISTGVGGCGSIQEQPEKNLLDNLIIFWHLW